MYTFFCFFCLFFVWCFIVTFILYNYNYNLFCLFGMYMYVFYMSMVVGRV